MAQSFTQTLPYELTLPLLRGASLNIGSRPSRSQTNSTEKLSAEIIFRLGELSVTRRCCKHFYSPDFGARVTCELRRTDVCALRCFADVMTTSYRFLTNPTRNGTVIKCVTHQLYCRIRGIPNKLDHACQL